jgi:transcriptional regulator with XRE-family HTH domain
VISRVTFNDEFARAVRVRGLTLTEVARLSGVSMATASSAVHGRPVNMRSAVLLSRALAATAAVPELEVWLAGAPAGDGDAA